MKRLLTLVAFFATIQASAQQVNPVPDYVFRNQMSVGRGTVTDTAAYFSIGPRYGAVKGFMPPIVVDTATFSSGKRNGLLIFSVQKNKFLYWDSVRVQWSDMAGSSGSYIVAGDTASMLSPYIRNAGFGLTKSGQSFIVDTLNISTRAWRQKGIDSLSSVRISGSGTTNRISKFTSSTGIGNSIIFDDGTNIGINTTSPQRTLSVQQTGGSIIRIQSAGTSGVAALEFLPSTQLNPWQIYVNESRELFFQDFSSQRMKISSTGQLTVNNLSGTGNRVVVSSSDGTLSASSSATDLIDTTTISTRAWRQKGLDSLAALEVSGSGTTNYVPKFTAGSTIGNSQIFDNGTNVGIGSITPGHFLDIQKNQNAETIARIYNTSTGASGNSQIRLENSASRLDMAIRSTGAGTFGALDAGSSYIWYNGTSSLVIGATDASGIIKFNTGGTTERLRIFANGRVGINTTTDAGYQLDVNGTLRSVNGANFATTSGNVGVGTASPRSKFELSNVGNTIAHISSFLTGTVAEPILIFLRSNNDNLGTLSATQTGQILGRIAFNGVESGNSSDDAAFIRAVQDGLASSFRVPAYIEFGTGNESENPTGRMRITKDGEVLINTTTDAGDYKLQVSGNIYSTGSYTSGSPSGGTARPWKLGSVVASTVILDTANYVEVEINGVAYKLALATPN